MLTLKMITEETDRVIRGLEKKHFKGAQESIAKVIELNDKRRSTQNQLDTNLAEVNSLSKAIGGLMKEGKKKKPKLLKSVLPRSRKSARVSRLKWIRLRKRCRTCFIQFRMFLMMKFLKV